jgi:hypothetical protein
MQRLAMASNLDLITSGAAMAYIDDWMFSSPSFEHHMDLMRLVFTRMKQVGLKVKLSKCQFFQRKINYLGHVITPNGLHVAQHHIDTIRNFPSPTNKKECRRLNGLFGYYRRFIANYAAIIRPILNLTQKDVEFDWTDKCENAKKTLIEKLISAPILAYPDFDAPFRLTTDASSTAIAGVLSQIQRDGTEHPIAFFSRTLNRAESRYPAVEQELMAIVFSVRHFAKFLYNHPVTIFTDNTACTALLKKPDLSPRLARWALSIQEHNVTIVYKEGRLNFVADSISRIPNTAAVDLDDDDEAVILDDLPNGASAKEFAEAQRIDYYLGPIILYLVNAKFPQDTTRGDHARIKTRAKHFRMIREVLFYVSAGKPLPAVPAALRRQLLFAHHTSLFGMHQGMTKTIGRLKERYWWPKLRHTVQQYISQCGSCQRHKDPALPIRLPYKFQFATEPWSVLAIDFQGPLPTTKKGNRHLLVFTDFFSKWVEMEATADQTAQTVARVYVERIICRFGTSQVLLSDRAQNFLSAVVASINKLFRVRHKKTTAYRPSTNGLVEVTNRTIKHMLSHFVNDHQDNWDDLVPFCQLAHNSSRHTVIDATPSMLLFGREVRIPMETIIPTADDEVEEGSYVQALRQRLHDVWTQARETIGRGRLKIAARREQVVNPADFRVGDTVLYRDKQGVRGKSRKLLEKWTGPWNVLRLTDTNAQIQLLSKPDSEPRWVHLEYLKPYLEDFVRGDEALEGFLPFVDNPDGDADLSDESDGDSGGSDSQIEEFDTASEGEEQVMPPAQNNSGESGGTASGMTRQNSSGSNGNQSQMDKAVINSQHNQHNIGQMKQVGDKKQQSRVSQPIRKSRRVRQTTRRPDFVYSSE